MNKNSIKIETIDITKLDVDSIVNEANLLRQQCVFSKESSKHAGGGILKRNFYTRFIPILRNLGYDMAKKMNSISVVRWLLPRCCFV